MGARQWEGRGRQGTGTSGVVHPRGEERCEGVSEVSGALVGVGVSGDELQPITRKRRTIGRRKGL